MKSTRSLKNSDIKLNSQEPDSPEAVSKDLRQPLFSGHVAGTWLAQEAINFIQNVFERRIGASRIF